MAMFRCRRNLVCTPCHVENHITRAQQVMAGHYSPREDAVALKTHVVIASEIGDREGMREGGGYLLEASRSPLVGGKAILTGAV